MILRSILASGSCGDLGSDRSIDRSILGNGINFTDSTSLVASFVNLRLRSGGLPHLRSSLRRRSLREHLQALTPELSMLASLAATRREL